MILYADWTSMALTLALVSADGCVVSRRESAADGAASVPAGEYPARLASLAGNWLEGLQAIYVSGMATARGNWQDTGYVSAPAELADLLAGAVRVGSMGPCPVVLLPGLSIDGRLPDVMRGEEVKAWGLAGSSSGLVVLPGKHSKWVCIEGGVIRHFATFISGEIGGLLRKDSILSRLIPAQAAVTEVGLAAGIEAAQHLRSVGCGVLRAAFSARSSALLGSLRPEDIPGYLEGLIIAAEIDEARSEFLSSFSGRVTLVGEAVLCERYAQAFQRIGLDCERLEGLELGARAIALIHQLQEPGTHAHNMEQPA